MTPELGMQSTAIKEKPEECERKIQQKNLAWVDNPDVQRLLDVAISILAEEYIQVAERNPDVFSSGAETTPNSYRDRETGSMNQTPTMLGVEKGKTNKNGGRK